MMNSIITLYFYVSFFISGLASVLNKYLYKLIFMASYTPIYAVINGMYNQEVSFYFYYNEKERLLTEIRQYYNQTRDVLTVYDLYSHTTYVVDKNTLYTFKQCKIRHKNILFGIIE